MHLAPHPRRKPRSRRHDARYRFSPHTTRRGTTLPALRRCRLTVSKGTRRIVDHAKIAPSTTAPATKSPLPSSSGHRQRQSTRLPPKPPLGQIPIDATPRTTARGFLPGAFGRRLSERARIAVTGRHPKPYAIADTRTTVHKSRESYELRPSVPIIRVFIGRLVGLTPFQLSTVPIGTSRITTLNQNSEPVQILLGSP